MVKVRFDHLAIETFQRLYGVNAFLEMADKATPQLEREEKEALKQLVKEEGWDFGDYDIESQNLDAKFQHWIPQLVAYSAVILLNSIVETQLIAYAERVGRTTGSKFRPQDIKGHGLEPAAIYLKNTADINIKLDPAWKTFKHLQDIRNIVVHKGGKPGDSPQEKRKIEILLQGFPSNRLMIQSDRYTLRSKTEIWISLSLCSEFAQTIEEFFKRLCKNAGLPDKGVSFGP